MREEKMKNKITPYIMFVVLIVFTLNASGCSKLFTPSNEEVTKAITESEAFRGGVGGLTLQPPIVILEKGGRNKEGFWPIKVKVRFTVYENQKTVSAPIEKTLVFNMSKTKNNAGKVIWKATLSS
jgi:hypothetical protein